ncbi:rRNA maturation RNase YbeY [Algoriphagus marinus]|uniref:rRNA maturation RNase YbeY n=1 Tax=Algoriphagus marinus TaxID=1925762 RepID=UPI00094B835F|nr:rRNA maturation RNase YbeY [Algoriphagus marinus]
MAINFFSEDTSFQVKQKLKRKEWLKEITSLESYKILDLNYIFCSDEYLHKINLQYLDHDTYTDIITFDNSEHIGKIEGDIYISIDRVKENAKDHKVDQETELSRVLSHGLFHLLGYKDKTSSESKKMREKEEFAISLYKKINCST